MKRFFVVIVSVLLAACEQMPTAPTSVQRLAEPPPAVSLQGHQGMAALGLSSALPTPATAGEKLAACLSGVSVEGCISMVSSASDSLSAPRNLVASVNGSTVTLIWAPPSLGGSVSTYVIEAGSRPGVADIAVLPTGNALTYIVVGGVPPGLYFVHVRAANSTGVSYRSETVAVGVGQLYTPNLTGTWLLTREGVINRNSEIYKTFVVTLYQGNWMLTGNIRPNEGERRATPILGEQSYFTPNGLVRFGSESPYWNDDTDTYFTLQLDSSGRRMTGYCEGRTYPCTVTAVKLN
jgi:hypothetical protein